MRPNWPTKTELLHNEQHTLAEVSEKVDAALLRIELSDYKTQRTILNLDWHQLTTLKNAVGTYHARLEYLCEIERRGQK